MNFIKQNKALFISIISLFIMILLIPSWNYIIKKQNESKEKTTPEIQTENILPDIEDKFGAIIEINQNKLLKYTKEKRQIWYLSSGYVKNVNTTNSITTITFSSTKESNNILKATIDSNKWEYQKGDTLNFLGSINLSNNELSLTKISKEPINYKNVIELQIDSLIENINKLKINYFMINGYMVTDNEEYKLYNSKESYKKDSSIGNYFTISWQDEFNYTGNQYVILKCKIEDTYKLNECELQQNTD